MYLAFRLAIAPGLAEPGLHGRIVAPQTPRETPQWPELHGNGSLHRLQPGNEAFTLPFPHHRRERLAQGVRRRQFRIVLPECREVLLLLQREIRGATEQEPGDVPRTRCRQRGGP